MVVRPVWCGPLSTGYTDTETSAWWPRDAEYQLLVVLPVALVRVRVTWCHVGRTLWRGRSSYRRCSFRDRWRQQKSGAFVRLVVEYILRGVRVTISNRLLRSFLCKCMQSSTFERRLKAEHTAISSLRFPDLSTCENHRYILFIHLFNTLKLFYVYLYIAMDEEDQFCCGRYNVFCHISASCLSFNIKYK